MPRPGTGPAGESRDIFASERCSRQQVARSSRRRGSRKPRRDRSRSTLTAPLAVEQNVVRIEVGMIDARAVQPRDRRADRAPGAHRSAGPRRAATQRLAHPRCAA